MVSALPACPSCCSMWPHTTHSRLSHHPAPLPHPPTHVNMRPTPAPTPSAAPGVHVQEDPRLHVQPHSLRAHPREWQGGAAGRGPASEAGGCQQGAAGRAALCKADAGCMQCPGSPAGPAAAAAATTVLTTRALLPVLPRHVFCSLRRMQPDPLHCSAYLPLLAGVPCASRAGRCQRASVGQPGGHHHRHHQRQRLHPHPDAPHTQHLQRGQPPERGETCTEAYQTGVAASLASQAPCAAMA